MPILFLYLVVLFGACIHPDPAVGAMMIMGVLLGLMTLAMLPLFIYNKVMEPKWKAVADAEWKKKYSNTKSLAEFIKELDNK